VYKMQANPMGISEVAFNFEANQLTMYYKNATGSHKITYGLGRNIEGSFPETHYSGKRINTPLGSGYKTQNSAAWRDGRTLLLITQVTDIYLGSLKITAHFEGANLTILMKKHAEAFLDSYQGFASGTVSSG